MRTRRERERKVYRLWELTRGRTLSTEERLAKSKKLHACWRAQRQAHIAAAQADGLDKRSATAAFWALVDAAVAIRLGRALALQKGISSSTIGDRTGRAE
jgi:hypothetical protein